MTAAPHGEELIRLGDERSEREEWAGAVASWRAAAAAGAMEAADIRLHAFVRQFGAAPPAIVSLGLPRRALQPLAICVEAALFGVLAMLAANRVANGPDAVLLGLGWASFAVAAVGAVVFAARSGRLDGGVADTKFAETADFDTVAGRATEIAARLGTERPSEFAMTPPQPGRTG